MAMLLNRAEMRPVRWLIMIGWMAFFLILLLQPEHHQLISTGIPPGPQSLERDLVFSAGHMLGFIITTVLWWWVFSAYTPTIQAAALAAVVSTVMSFTTEWLQSFTPDRLPQISDLLANAAGACLVFFVLRWLEKRRVSG